MSALRCSEHRHLLTEWVTFADAENALWKMASLYVTYKHYAITLSAQSAFQELLDYYGLFVLMGIRVRPFSEYLAGVGPCGSFVVYQECNNPMRCWFRSRAKVT
jgi:hypothetical protein